MLDTVEVLNLATGNSSLGPSLPAAAGSGCAAFDSDTGYMYYVEGIEGVEGAAVFRIASELRERMLRATMSRCRWDPLCFFCDWPARVPC